MTDLTKKTIIILVVIFIGAAFYLHKDVSNKPSYISSKACKDCHKRHYDGWSKTLHPKMFRPVKSPEDILGDFNSKDPALTFKKEDVEFVVGNKWEQVYVKMIDGEYYPLTAKWYIQLNKWVPFKVKDWKETPMSPKCNGCHTTGFDPETFEFSEFGIGCEACHGPGNIHVQNRQKRSYPVCALCHSSDKPEETDIIKSVNSAVCGQCHSRGQSVREGEGGKPAFNFPVNVTPGEDIKKYFNLMKPDKGKENKFWWGNGISKNRHQEFADWQNSKHSESLRLMKEKDNKVRGKMNVRCLRCHSTDYRLSKKGDEPDLETARFGVTCVACHDPHGLDRGTSFKKDGTYVCAGCHIDSISFHSGRKGKPHYPCPPSQVACADCHMPYIVKTGGYFSIRSHAFQIIKPADAEALGMPSSCQNGTCHKDRTIDWAKMEFDKFYPSTDKPL